MEFSPNNPIVKTCLQGMEQEEKNNTEEASKIFLKAWNEATSDFEKFLTAFYVARHQKNASDRLEWYQTSLQHALKVNDAAANSALLTLHNSITKCYEELNDVDNAKQYYDLANSLAGNPSDKGPFYHGTKANMQVGDLLTAGYQSNYKTELIMNHIYFTALLNGAGLAAALANGDGLERVYIVEPTGNFENDPNVTDKKFPGNLTRSYRTAEPLKIIGEMKDWLKQMPEELQKWRERLANNKGEIIN